jgi:multidrug efflux pump subunit AcrA (membrane-fusion protein)
MNPNKHNLKERSGWAFSFKLVEGKLHAVTPVTSPTEFIRWLGVNDALERENKELKEKLSNAQDTIAELDQLESEMKARAEKAEAERDKAAEERGVWESEAYRLAGTVSEQTGQIENVETGARECRVTLGAERKDYEALKARAEKAELEAHVAKDQLGVYFERANKAEAKLAELNAGILQVRKSVSAHSNANKGNFLSPVEVGDLEASLSMLCNEDGLGDAVKEYACEMCKEGYENKLAALLASNETLTRKQVEIEKDLREYDKREQGDMDEMDELGAANEVIDKIKDILKRVVK